MSKEKSIANECQICGGDHELYKCSNCGGWFCKKCSKKTDHTRLCKDCIRFMSHKFENELLITQN